MKRVTSWIVTVWFVLFFVQKAVAGGFYLLPTLGAAFPTEGDADPSVGVGVLAGYEFTSYLAAGVGYRYLYATGSDDLNSTHLYDANVTLFKRLVVLTPYVRLGGGAYTMTFDQQDSRTDALFNLGGGVHIHPIPFIGFTLGFTYYVASGALDFVEPAMTLGFSLGK
jgi:hypothetical protein